MKMLGGRAPLALSYDAASHDGKFISTAGRLLYLVAFVVHAVWNRNHDRQRQVDCEVFHIRRIEMMNRDSIRFRRMLLTVICVGCLPSALAFSQVSTVGKSTTKPLKVGSLAPEFVGLDENGDEFRSTDVVGEKILVVFFYPGDFTVLATNIAKQFNQDMVELRERDVELVGISADPQPNHLLFKEANSFDFPLLSDPKGEIAARFGVRLGKGGTVRKKVAGKLVQPRELSFGWRVLAIDKSGKIAFNKPRVNSLTNIDLVFQQLAKDFWANRSDKKPLWIPSEDRDWKRILTRKQYAVMRRKQTERPFTSKTTKKKTKGIYRCAGCGQLMFAGAHKFDSGTGWPSFWEANRGKLIYAEDLSDGTPRMEVNCRQCKSHLGHVFGDGPAPTGKRYCINSASIVLDRQATRSN